MQVSDLYGSFATVVRNGRFEQHEQTILEVSSAMRAIGYVRVSTNRQADNGLSLRAQTEDIERYCAANDLELLTVIPDVMSTRKTHKMYGRMAAVAAIEAGLADVLVVKALDRASRDTVDGGTLMRTARDQGWRVLSLDGVDSSDDSQQFLNDIRLAIAADERRKISERTKAALASKRRRGEKLGQPSPIDPKIVALIVKLRADGLSYPKIAKQLTDDGISAPRGDVWHFSTVRNVLKRQGV